MTTVQTEGSSPFFTYVGLWEANERTIGINTLREWGRSGRLRTVRIGRRILIPKSELERLPEIAEGRQ